MSSFVVLAALAGVAVALPLAGDAWSFSLKDALNKLFVLPLFELDAEIVAAVEAACERVCLLELG